MRHTLLNLIAGSALLLACLYPGHANASSYDKLTYFTFSGAVRVPGAVLPAGTYRFKLADPASSRKMVQIASKNGETVYAVCYTLDEERDSRDVHRAAVVFREAPQGQPPPIRSWFYPNEVSGYALVYPPQDPGLDKVR